LAVAGISKLPTCVKVTAALLIGGALLHKKSREWICSQMLILSSAVTSFGAPVLEVVVQFINEYSEAERKSKLSRKAIEEALPLKKRLLPAIVLLRRALLSHNQPLTEAELARLLKRSGYRSRSKTPTKYLRGVMLKDGRFSEVSRGMWEYGELDKSHF
jgi:hypothetical protein